MGTTSCRMVLLGSINLLIDIVVNRAYVSVKARTSTRVLESMVLAVDPDRGVVMRDGEGENLPVDLILALDSTEELDDASHRKGHTVGVPPACDIESSGAAFSPRRRGTGITYSTWP